MADDMAPVADPGADAVAPMAGHWHPAVHPETGAHGWQWSGPGGPTCCPPTEFPKDWPFSPSESEEPAPLTSLPRTPAPGSPTLPELLADLAASIPPLKRLASELCRRLGDFEDSLCSVSRKLHHAQQQDSTSAPSQGSGHDSPGAQILHSSQED